MKLFSWSWNVHRLNIFQLTAFKTQSKFLIIDFQNNWSAFIKAKISVVEVAPFGRLSACTMIQSYLLNRLQYKQYNQHSLYGARNHLHKSNNINRPLSHVNFVLRLFIIYASVLDDWFEASSVHSEYKWNCLNLTVQNWWRKQDSITVGTSACRIIHLPVWVEGIVFYMCISVCSTNIFVGNIFALNSNLSEYQHRQCSKQRLVLL